MDHNPAAQTLPSLPRHCHRHLLRPLTTAGTPSRHHLFCFRENGQLRRAVRVLQEAEGRSESRCRAALARLHEIEETEVKLEAAVDAQSASKKEKDVQIAALQEQLSKLRWVGSFG